MAGGFLTTNVEYSNFDMIKIASTTVLSVAGNSAIAVAYNKGKAGPV